MMMKKILIIMPLFALFFTFNAYSSSSLSGITMKGFYDSDHILDSMVCDEAVDGLTTCEVNFSLTMKNKFSYKNEYCSDASIENPKIGEVILHCGIWGEDTLLYFSWNETYNDLILDKKVSEKLAMNGPDSKIESKTYELKNHAISFFDTENYLINNNY